MSGRIPVPFSRSYWVVPERLLAGLYPGSVDPDEERQKLSALLECGVNCFFNLMRKDELDIFVRPFRDYSGIASSIAGSMNRKLNFLRYPITDMDIPTRDFMRTILDSIDRELAEGNTIYIHCLGGVGRTGTVVGCYLARHGIATGDNALAAIDALRNHRPGRDMPSPQTHAQCELVRSWGVGE